MHKPLILVTGATGKTGGGRPAKDFETIASHYAAAPLPRRARAKLVRMLGRVAILPLVPQMRIDRYASTQDFPTAPCPGLSVEDAGWRGGDDLPAMTATE